jgi:hypothetical protein
MMIQPRTLWILAGLLGVQLLLALALSLWGREEAQRSAAREPLLALSADQIDRLVIEARGPGERVELRRQGEGWVLAGGPGPFPAAAGEVQRLLERLLALRQGVPVATRAEAHERFGLSDDRYERRIVLARGEQTLAALVLGSSAALGRSHARVDGHNTVHVVELPAYEVSVRPDDWRDLGLLAVSKAQLERIEVAGLVLRPAADDGGAEGREGPQWQAQGLPQGRRLDPQAGERLAGLLATLRVSRVLAQDDLPAQAWQSPQARWSLVRQGDASPVEYILARGAADDTYRLKVSTRPEVFELPAATATQWIEATRLDRLTTAGG